MCTAAASPTGEVFFCFLSLSVCAEENQIPTFSSTISMLLFTSCSDTSRSFGVFR